MEQTVRLLKDGYWDRTALVRGPGGGLRVRKESKESAEPGPWAHAALRTEIAYLGSLSDDAAGFFPRLLDSWDGETIGYEMPFCEGRQDFARLVLTGDADQQMADRMQRDLAEALFGTVHRPVGDDGFFVAHLRTVFEESVQALAADARFAPLAGRNSVVVNGCELPGMARSLEGMMEHGLLDKLAATAPVRLHGDLILENILWEPLLLIDPVSVAGLDRGHPLFDLVKYESYASGELYAIREEYCEAGPVQGGYAFQVDPEEPALAPFQQLDLRSTFRRGYVAAHGKVDPGLYTLLDAYFSLVMARNTRGVHQWARVVKAAECLSELGAGTNT